MKHPIPRILTIAGSDSGGGAGIEGDLKTIMALGGYGMAAVTAVTAQNTLRVTGIYDMTPTAVAAQIDAVMEDIGTDAAKTGMLANAGIINAVAACVERHGIRNLVVDPVMVAKSGDYLLQLEACAVLKANLLPLATVITPNLPEAEVLLGRAIPTDSEIRHALEDLKALGPKYVVLKGGHINSQEVTDYLFDGEVMRAYTTRRLDTKHTHGTGCTFSAAVATYLGQGRPVPEAARLAKDYVTGAILHADKLQVGSGHGPLNHGWKWQEREEQADA